MIVSILAALVVFCTFYGRMSVWVLAALSALFAAVLTAARRHHSDDSVTSIDQIAVNSGLAGVNPALKSVLFTGVLVATVASRSGLFAGSVLLTMAAATVLAGRVRPGKYLQLLTIPAVFILASALALLFDRSSAASGVLNVPFAGGYWVLTRQSQASALLVTLKALGAVSCLYALTLTTPLFDIICVLRGARLPELVIELMFLIYRYIFVLSDLMGTMRTAAASRFGFQSYRACLRTSGGIMTNLLALSFRRASAAFDAMESRCYAGRLRFLTPVRPLRARHVLAAGGYAACLAAVWITERICT